MRVYVLTHEEVIIVSKLRWIIPVSILGLILLLASGCVAPGSFVQTMEPVWASVEIREGIDYEHAWASVIDLVARKFDLEVISKEGGYVRSSWMYTWTGEFREDYRVRIIVKFSPDRSKVEVKSEANYRSGAGFWVIGSDTVVLQTLKTDIMGTIGRVTR